MQSAQVPLPADPPEISQAQESHQALWEASLKRQLNALRVEILQIAPALLAARSGGDLVPNGLRLMYWGRPCDFALPELTASDPASGQALSQMDTLLLLYYLRTADGTPLADRWVSFRELLGGMFYHQAFQGYTGDRLAKIFDPDPGCFQTAAIALNGVCLTNVGDFAFAFQVLPRLRLAALFWPGDDEFQSRASILFDTSSLHYMVLDGLAVLGARLVSQFEKLQGNQVSR